MSKKETGLSESQLAILNDSYPVSTEDSSRLQLPRLGLLSKDVIEETGTGKNKKIKVIQAAGAFYTEKDEGEISEETGKSVWTRNYFEDETLDVNVIYHRYQLKFYDEGLKKWYSSPVYDTPDQTIKLYLDGKEVKKGTEKELQAMFPKVTQKGKAGTALDKLTILFIIYEGDMYQFNLSKSGGYEFSAYKRRVNPSTVVTTLSSVQKEVGSNVFNVTMFKPSRQISPDEFETVSENQAIVRNQVQVDSQFMLPAPQEKSVEEEYDKM